jgi:hypothetical protein
MVAIDDINIQVGSIGVGLGKDRSSDGSKGTMMLGGQVEFGNSSFVMHLGNDFFGGKGGEFLQATGGTQHTRGEEGGRIGVHLDGSGDDCLRVVMVGCERVSGGWVNWAKGRGGSEGVEGGVFEEAGLEEVRRDDRVSVLSTELLTRAFLRVNWGGVGVVG